jgi:hypothetical protein
MKAAMGAFLCMMMMTAAGVQAAQAQPALRLDTRLFVERVTTDLNGRPRRTLAGADRVMRGDTVVVLLDWRNEGAQPVRDLALTRSAFRGAVPDLSDPAVLVSIDGGARFARFDSLWLPTPLGGVRRAVAEDVTHVRWRLPRAMPPGERGRISWRTVAR